MITIVSLGGFCNINTRWLKAVASFLKKHFSSLFQKVNSIIQSTFFFKQAKIPTWDESRRWKMIVKHVHCVKSTSKLTALCFTNE